MQSSGANAPRDRRMHIQPSSRGARSAGLMRSIPHRDLSVRGVMRNDSARSHTGAPGPIAHRGMTVERTSRLPPSLSISQYKPCSHSNSLGCGGDLLSAPITLGIAEEIEPDGGSSKITERGAPALPTWPDEIYRVLKDAGIRQVAMVPDAGHSRLIRSFEADPETRVVTLTTEEEGVAMLAGAWLGGERGVLLLQSSGVGNCINMLSLPVICHMPLLMIVTMRGDWGEFNPWQIPMGQGTRPSLEAMGVIVNKVDEPHLVASTVQGAAHLAFNTWKPVAVLIGQRVLGAKNFKELARK